MTKLQQIDALIKVMREKQDRLNAIDRRLEVIKGMVPTATEDEINALSAEVAELGEEGLPLVADVKSLAQRVRALIAEAYRSPFTARG